LHTQKTDPVLPPASEGSVPAASDPLSLPCAASVASSPPPAFSFILPQQMIFSHFVNNPKLSRSCGERASSPQAAYHSLPPEGESSLAPLRLLSPQSLTTLRGPLLGTRRRHGARNLFGENGNGKQNGGNA